MSRIIFKDVAIHYTDQGSGPVVVLLHGFLENSSMWSSLVAKLVSQKRVICIDLPGHGQTGCIGNVHSMETMAKVVSAVLKYLRLKMVTLIGHSMGGYVALAFTEEHPEMVKGICLMNSTALPDSADKKINRSRGIRVVKQNYSQFVKTSVLNLFKLENRTIYSNEIDKVTQQALNTPVQGIIAALEGMKRRPNRSELLRIPNINKLIMVGEADPVLDYQSILNQIKDTNVELVTLSGGHMAHIENKYTFIDIIMQFVNQKKEF